MCNVLIVYIRSFLSMLQLYEDLITSSSVVLFANVADVLYP